MYQEKIKDFLRELSNTREDLPFSPTLLQQLHSQTGENSNATMQQIGETLSKDQGVTARILSLANSSYYGLQAEVGSVERAAAVIGLNEIRNIVLMLGVQRLASKYPLPEDFVLAEYWGHHFLVGTVAKELSRLVGVGNPQNLFTAGLLHDIGKLITAMFRPDDWQAMVELAEEEEIVDSEAEDRYWGVDHAVIGALVLKSWDLPEILVEPVNWHHSPELAPGCSNEATIICLADYAAHAVADPEGPYAGRVEQLCIDMELDLDEVMEITEELAESDEVEEFVQLLN